MTALLPDVVQEAVRGRSVYSASESFGVVTLVVLVLLLVEHQGLRIVRTAPARAIALSAVIGPLLAAVALTIAMRLLELVP